MKKIVTVSFDVEIPDVDVTDRQVEDWLRFELNDNGSLMRSPISNNELEPIFGTFTWRWK